MPSRVSSVVVGFMNRLDANLLRHRAAEPDGTPESVQAKEAAVAFVPLPLNARATPHVLRVS